MKRDDRDLLIETATSAFRARDPEGRILPSPAWMDLAPEDRDELFERQLASRRAERVLDTSGLSTTARAVLSRIGRLEQLRREE
jgi:hypothetical protein